MVNVEACYQDDPIQLAVAAVLKADLDYRMARGAALKHSIPWFQICMGGCHDSQLTGVTVSKQYWQYEEVPARETVQKPLIDDVSGQPVFDAVTGEPILYEMEVEGTRVTMDRPMVDLIPIENVYVDPAAPWFAPAQLGRWFSVKYPMGLSDVRAMLNSPMKGGVDPGWIAVDDVLLLKGRLEDDQTGTRRAREAGSDRYEEAKGVNDLDIIWLQENFLRISGVDYHWWSIGRHGYISKVREVQKSYPHLDGERPYVMGVGAIDPHRVFPMSPVESWQPLQLELNDITNLRQDTLKRAIAPLALVKRGKNVDTVALQRRGQPDAMVLLDDPAGDVILQQTPGPSGAAYTETSVTSVMFDELAGVFSSSSVQSNRQLNETVGGMRMLSGAANAVSEFNLRIWVESWVEQVMRQLIHLLRAYESDKKILAIAGTKARVWQEFKATPTLADFYNTDVTLKVNVGIGALDPMQQLSKLKFATEMLAPMMPVFNSQGIKLKGDVWIEEVMGKAGYRDGRRFFEFGEPAEQQPDPEIVKLMEEMKLKNKELEVGLRETMLELQSKEKIEEKDNATQLMIEELRANKDLLGQLVDVEHDREGRVREDARDERQFARENEVRREEGAQSRRQRIAEILSKRVGGENDEAMSGVLQGAVAERTFTALDQIMYRLETMAMRAGSVEGAVVAIANHLTSPTEIVRDPDTRAVIGVRKGGRLQQVLRGPDNRITGTLESQPATSAGR